MIHDIGVVTGCHLTPLREKHVATLFDGLLKIYLSQRYSTNQGINHDLLLKKWYNIYYVQFFYSFQIRGRETLNQLILVEKYIYRMHV